MPLDRPPPALPPIVLRAVPGADDVLTPEALAYIIRNLVIRDESITTESLTELRAQIDKIDDELLELLARRMRVSRDIGQFKKEHNMPVLQAQRYEELLERRAGQAVRLGMEREFMRTVMQAIHEEKQKPAPSQVFIRYCESRLAALDELQEGLQPSDLATIERILTKGEPAFKVQ